MYLMMKQFIFSCEQEAIQYVTSKLFYIMQRKCFSFVHQYNTIMDCHLLYLIQRFTHVLIIEIFVLAMTDKILIPLKSFNTPLFMNILLFSDC